MCVSVPILVIRFDLFIFSNDYWCQCVSVSTVVFSVSLLHMHLLMAFYWQLLVITSFNIFFLSFVEVGRDTNRTSETLWWTCWVCRWMPIGPQFWKTCKVFPKLSYLASCWYVCWNFEAYGYLFSHHAFVPLDLNLFYYRHGWLWSRLLSHPSHSPVKGLYLYGGVGTGKTMLMDLFYDQLWVWHEFLCVNFLDGIFWGTFRMFYANVLLWGVSNLVSDQLYCMLDFFVFFRPSNWRKKRIHFHDFMLNVHSLLQVSLQKPLTNSKLCFFAFYFVLDIEKNSNNYIFFWSKKLFKILYST